MRNLNNRSCIVYLRPIAVKPLSVETSNSYPQLRSKQRRHRSIANDNRALRGYLAGGIRRKKAENCRIFGYIWSQKVRESLGQKEHKGTRNLGRKQTKKAKKERAFGVSS